MKLIIGTISLFLAVLFFSPVSSFAEMERVTIEEMEAHWQQLINEDDVQKRAAMLVEHRKMMAAMEAQGHGQDDESMMHRMEMQNMMMHMME